MLITGKGLKIKAKLQYLLV